MTIEITNLELISVFDQWYKDDVGGYDYYHDDTECSEYSLAATSKFLEILSKVQSCNIEEDDKEQ